MQNYKPLGQAPLHKLYSDSSSEEVTTFCQKFKTYIISGKAKESMNVPHNMVMGVLSGLCETQFYDNVLRLYIKNNRPPTDEYDDRMSEDIIVDLIYHYYSSTSLVYSRITPACVYNH